MLTALRRRLRLLDSLDARLRSVQEAVGRLESRSVEGLSKDQIAKCEFKVYSQWGEDGIIQFLLRHVKITRKIFVEFGVETYLEANTRYLLVNDNWAGLVIDGSESNVATIKRDPVFWKHNLKAEHAFVTRANINELLQANGIQGEIGLLSIDIDGNDYWIWEAIEVVSPAIVIIEYNSLFGPSAPITIPYEASFDRTARHYSNLYWGASLSALCALAERKGMRFVGSNAAGCNAFFVKSALLNGIPALSPQEGYVPIAARQSRDPEGQLTFLSFAESQRLIIDEPVFDIDGGNVITLREALTKFDGETRNSLT